MHGAPHCAARNARVKAFDRFSVASCAREGIQTVLSLPSGRELRPHVMKKYG